MELYFDPTRRIIKKNCGSNPRSAWELLGPIKDTQGVEQGGCPSDRVYRLTNNEQLETAQRSQLGVDMGL
jgi:hypothetical protein